MKPFKGAEPKQYTIRNIQLKCPHCGHDHFYTRQAQLNTAMRTFFNLDWADRSATCFVCAECTHIEWFLGQ